MPVKVRQAFSVLFLPHRGASANTVGTKDKSIKEMFIHYGTTQ